MRLIGLTGTIASGKSTVSERLSEHGAHIIDADKVSREVVERGSDGLFMLQKAFGELIVNRDGTLNRRLLAEIVFFEREKLNTLNEIMHPLILDKMRSVTRDIAKKDKEATVVWDAALLIETGLYKDTDEIWLVTAPEELRILRMTMRDGISREQAAARIRAQLPEEVKRRYATAVINNDGRKDELYKVVDKLWSGRNDG